MSKHKKYDKLSGLTKATEMHSWWINCFLKINLPVVAFNKPLNSLTTIQKDLNMQEMF